MSDPEEAERLRHRSLLWGIVLFTFSALFLMGAGQLVAWALFGSGALFVICGLLPADWWEDED